MPEPARQPSADNQGTLAAPLKEVLNAGGEPRMLRKEIVVRAPLEMVWTAWTTVHGLTFISKQSRVELRVGGPFELFLDTPADDRGMRGAEGCRVLAFVPRQMLAFDWTFPPEIPGLRRREARTQAAVFLDEIHDGSVRVRFVQHGWSEGAEWDAGYAYFDRAWDAVLNRLKAHVESAPPG